MAKVSFPDVQILDGQGAPIYDGPLQGLRFPEKLIIGKSIEFFHDPEPCFIHRSAVASRLVVEIDVLLRNQNEFSVETLEESHPSYLGEYTGARRLRLKKAESHEKA
jgi:hypothetical protein